jgi:hypothetical protein
MQPISRAESALPLSIDVADVCDSYDNPVYHTAVPMIDPLGSDQAQPQRRATTFLESAHSAELPLPHAPAIDEAGQSTLFDAVGRPVLLKQALRVVAGDPWLGRGRQPPTRRRSMLSHSTDEVSRESFEPMYEREADDAVLRLGRIRSIQTESNLARLGQDMVAAAGSRFSLDVPRSSAARCAYGSSIASSVACL